MLQVVSFHLGESYSQSGQSCNQSTATATEKCKSLIFEWIRTPFWTRVHFCLGSDAVFLTEVCSKIHLPLSGPDLFRLWFVGSDFRFGERLFLFTWISQPTWRHPFELESASGLWETLASPRSWEYDTTYYAEFSRSYCLFSVISGFWAYQFGLVDFQELFSRLKPGMFTFL